MPKRSRQAHVPQPHQVRRRKARREGTVPNMPEPVVAEEPVLAVPTAQTPVATRSRRRLVSLSAPAETPVQGRASAGQLPAFDRAYITRELRTIAITSGLLLAVIVALTLIMR